MNNQVRLIVFDLWNTLVWEKGNLKELFRIFTADERSRFKYEDFVALDEEILMQRVISVQTGLKLIARRLGIKNVKNVTRTAEMWIQSVNDCYMYPDVVPTLCALRRRGVRLGLITNTTKDGWLAVDRRFDLGRWFDYRLLSFEVGLTKPDQKIFQRMEEMSEFARRDILMVGDSEKSDIAPAVKRGWQTRLIARPKDSIGFLATM